MTDQDRQREAFPDAGDGLAEIHERQKARGKNEPVKLPPCRWETAWHGETVESGEIKDESEVK